jgi:hypothetical protein
MQMNNEHELRATQERLRMIDQQISSLQAERSRLDKLIANLATKAGDDGLPCWQCQSLQAPDVRHWLASNQNPAVARSAAGLPLNCCRIETFQSRPIVTRHA